jgi:hypothetical protein
MGYAGGNDPSGRPLSPSLYITDITNNQTSRSGDWQYGGASYAPNAVFGAWKSYAETINNSLGGAVTLTGANDPARNQWNLGTGSDAPPAGLTNGGYGAEVQWNLTTLQNQGVLLPGHNYRFYVMVHDGDQNKSGGDVGQASYQVNNPIPIPPGSLSGYVYNESSAFAGLANVVVTLSGQMTTKTDGTGLYTFSGLSAGTYSITETPPLGYSDDWAQNIIGSLGGVNSQTTPTTISSIVLQGNALNGINYDFADVMLGS